MFLGRELRQSRAKLASLLPKVAADSTHTALKPLTSSMRRDNSASECGESFDYLVGSCEHWKPPRRLNKGSCFRGAWSRRSTKASQRFQRRVSALSDLQGLNRSQNCI